MTDASIPSRGPTYPDDASDAERTRWCNALVNMRVLADAADRSVAEILSVLRFRRRPARETVIAADERAGHIHFLIDGVVRVFQEKEGVQYTAKLLTAPTHFGELALLAGLDTYRSSIETLTPAVTAEAPFATLESLLAADPRLTRAWLYSLARQFSVTVDFLKQTVFGGVGARLANVLLSYAHAFGRDAGQGWVEINYELSYAELAHEAACTRRAAILAMQAFSEETIARRTERGWAIRPAPLEQGLLPGRLSLVHSLDDNRKPGE
jgi:CRP-like cAMP-binding protein